MGVRSHLADPMNGTDELNCTSVFDDPSFLGVGLCRAVLSTVSIILCSCAIVMILTMKKWKSLSQRLVLYLLMASTLQSISSLLSVQFTPNQSVGFCKLSGFMIQTSVLIFLNAILSITIYLFLLIVANYNSEKYKVVYFLGIFLSPLLITWIPLVKDAYGRAGVWCWIVSVDKLTCKHFIFGQVMQYVLYFVPMYIILLLMVFLYLTMVINLLWKQSKQSWASSRETKNKLQMMKSELLSLVAYPIIYTILGVPTILNRVYDALYPNKPSIVLWYCAAIMGPLYGIFTAIAFTVGTKMCHDFSCYKAMALLKKDKCVKPYKLGKGVESDNLIKQNSYGTALKQSHV